MRKDEPLMYFCYEIEVWFLGAHTELENDSDEISNSKLSYRRPQNHLHKYITTDGRSSATKERMSSPAV